MKAKLFNLSDALFIGVVMLFFVICFFVASNLEPCQFELAFLGKIGGFLGGIAKGVGKAIKGVPLVGQIVTVGEEAIKGAFGRAAGAASVQSQADVLAQRQFQTQQNIGTGFGLGAGNILSNPLFLVAATGFIVWIAVRRR